jgi:leucyl/phenylalanyl-tRNA--protein transferase
VTVYRLGPEPVFPPPSDAEASGLLAVGGDLSSPRLLAAYAAGIFPWYEDPQPILWFSPDPRWLLLPRELRLARRLARTLRQRRFEVTLDTAFDRVIRGCASVRRSAGNGTWITPAMLAAYEQLFALGFAHSAEAWSGGELVGGVYGLSLGGGFFGESMFTLRPDASKVALVTLVRQLADWGFDFLDCQVHTPHLQKLGARAWPRALFLQRLAATLARETRRGRWRLASPAVMGSAGTLV